MEKVKVTVAVITKNEETLIGRCLDSLRWADDILVVDGYSTDRTQEIARSKGARVIEHKFTGSFADDRNVGIDNARNDWVLNIDADDVVTDDFRNALVRALSGDEGVVIYKFRRRNFFLGHSMDHGGFHHYIPNLVRRGSVRYEGLVHEVPAYSGKMGVIDADINHYPFDSITQFINRQNRYTDIAAVELFKVHGVLPEREIRKMMINKSLKMFWKSYIKKQGRKEGLYGLIFAILFALINFLKWSKYWELIRSKNG